VKVTRIACSASLNAGRYALLEEQARRLGRVRSKVWREYGSVSVTDRAIRDRWMADGTAGGFGVLANAWKETVRDAAGDVKASRESAKVRVRRPVFRRTADPAERKRLCAALKAEEWAGDPYLSRLMRKHWQRGRSKVANQIVVRADHAAAINILQRASDPDITPFTPHTRVRQILRERADRQRARLPAQDSSPAARGGERNILTCSGASSE